MPPLVAPGPMFPLSNDPSFMTMRWTTLSAFCQTTSVPCGMGAGFGLNDWSFLCPMMLTVTAGPETDGVGIDAVMLDDDPPLPHPHAARTKTPMATWERMSTN
jgi:hypothetical protein